MSDGITNQSGFMCATDADAAEAKRRAEWLHKHKAHKDWIILSVSEIAVIRGELLAVERELAETREAAKLITMDESLYAAKCIEFYATITPEGIEDLWPQQVRSHMDDI